MNSLLTENQAQRRVSIIAAFYVISGLWEILHLMQGENLSFYLLDLYHIYVAILGLITILVGLGLAFRLNIARIFALFIAWWNLFTAPALEIWWSVYKILIKKIAKIDSLPQLYLLIFGTIIIVLILTSVRIYVIFVLKKSKAGFVFQS